MSVIACRPSTATIEPPVSFRPIDTADLPVLRSWFTDAELARRVAYPADDWYDHVTGRYARCWIVHDGAGTALGWVQVDRADPDIGHLDIAAHPGLRGVGVGREILAAFVSGPGRAYGRLEGRIAPDNRASLACAQHCGFDPLHRRDDDGFVRVVRSMRPRGW